MRTKAVRAPRSSVMAIITSLALGGCATTQMTVSKVDTNPEIQGPNGIRYSLPKPFLLVTPSAAGDGTFSVGVVHLPDECHTYAIDARTKRGKYDLAVTLKEGLLEKVVWSQKDAELLADSVKAGSEIAKAEIERREAKKKESTDAADAEKKAALTEVKTIQEQLNEKQLAVNLAALDEAAAQAAIDEGNTSTEAKAALRTAQLTLQKAVAARDFVAKLLDDATARATALNALNVPKKADIGTATTTQSTPRFWSPVLYAIDDKGTSVSLRAVNWQQPGSVAATKCGEGKSAAASQLQFDTVKIEAPKPANPPAHSDPPAILGSTDLARRWTKGSLRFTLVLDRPVVGLKESMRRIKPDVDDSTPLPTNTFFVALASGRQSIRVEFPGKPLAPGRYRIEIPLTFRDPGEEKPKDGSVSVLLTVEK